MAEFNLFASAVDATPDFTAPQQGGQSFPMRTVEPPSGGVSTSYRMRGYDTTLVNHVYWNSTSIDAAGSSYAGPGPLIDIGVVRRIS